ncbi:putative immunity/bacteriocin fusion bifunctional protein [Lysinibacillus sp. NPDC097231]|uniref:putative immunity/bacteriocin fusion bifunctional protein n=1 Tax=Lysinibacillus sp. NPDC097231 TaxID=3364142 RepID=UPI00382ADF9B
MKKFIAILSLVVFLGFNLSTSSINVNAQDSNPLVDSSQTAISNCEPCGKKTETPESTGTKQEQAQAVNVVEKSDKFKNTSQTIKDNNGKVKLLGVNVVEGRKQATVAYKVENANDGLSVITYFVDFSSQEVPLEQKMFANEVIKGELVNITWTMNDEDFLNVNINKDGMIEEGNNEYTLDQYLTKHEESLTKRAGEISTMSVCSWAVGLLCAAGTSWACYGLCGVAAIVNVLGGAGCAIACGIIFGGGGCIAAVETIC